jgi:hypothetical protein
MANDVGVLRKRGTFLFPCLYLARQLCHWNTRLWHPFSLLLLLLLILQSVRACRRPQHLPVQLAAEQLAREDYHTTIK